MSNYKVQSVLLSKKHFTKAKAIEWILEHGYQNKKIDISMNYYRFRQLDPNYVERQGYKKMRMKVLVPDQIELVIAYKD